MHRAESGLDGGPGTGTHAWQEFNKDSETCSASLGKRVARRWTAVNWLEEFGGGPLLGGCLGHRAAALKHFLPPTVNRLTERMTTHFRSGPAFGLSAEVKSKVGSRPRACVVPRRV